MAIRRPLRILERISLPFMSLHVSQSVWRFSPGLTQGLIPLPKHEIPPEKSLDRFIRPNVLVQSVTRELLVILSQNVPTARNSRKPNELATLSGNQRRVHPLARSESYAFLHTASMLQ